MIRTQNDYDYWWRYWELQKRITMRTNLSSLCNQSSPCYYHWLLDLAQLQRTPVDKQLFPLLRLSIPPYPSHHPDIDASVRYERAQSMAPLVEVLSSLESTTCLPSWTTVLLQEQGRYLQTTKSLVSSSSFMASKQKITLIRVIPHEWIMRMLSWHYPPWPLKSTLVTHQWVFQRILNHWWRHP